MAKSKLPIQLYVTAKHADYWDKNNPSAVRPQPLGFLNAYEPGKAAFISKKKTQEEWAYKEWEYMDFNLEQHGPEFWIVGVKRGPWGQRPDGRSGYEEIPFSKRADPQPAIWQNDPMPGFRVLKSVTRSAKFWRILDPRGIQFEISTACMETIIDEAGVKKGGEIDAKCAWMSNKNLIVVP